MSQYNFKGFAASIAAHYGKLSQHELFRTQVSGDSLWDAYLDAFPEGTNPMFRKRTDHDGSYDRHFIRRMGNVVAIVDGQPVSIWDTELEYPYNVVAERLSRMVHDAPVSDLFRTSDSFVGQITNVEHLPQGGEIRWFHFHAAIDRRHITRQVDTVLGDARTSVAVLRRGLEEITLAALASIIELIDSKSLYRGDEHRAQVAAFQAVQSEYRNASNKDAYPWQHHKSGVARFRNTAIGTLAVALSSGEDIESAVASFEKKVAPENYKRPTALITQGMVDQATETIQSLGLEPSLERRYARLSDVSINNVLWVSNAAQGKMKDGVAALLADAVTKKPASKDNAEEISVDQFLGSVLPKARTMELLLEGRHQKNLVSLTAPVNADAPRLFKWDNGFAWSYIGEITDAIKERVKKAGGNVHADLRVSLSWHNFDDLDLHCSGPYGHVYFGNKLGILDVDMNAGSGSTRNPVENLAFMKPRDGVYMIAVDQYQSRENSNTGFTVEVECNGKVEQFTHPFPQRTKVTVGVMRIVMKGGAIDKLDVLDSKIQHRGVSQSVWGVKTETFVPVSTVMLSPNHWDGLAVGNKHAFFLLDGCRNSEATRRVYNEFLRGDLEQHRKVFEVLGAKTKCAPADDQLSGVGFSSTVRESVTVRAIGQTINKLYKINF